MRLTAAGLLAGLSGALVFSGWLDSQLFGISSRDLVTFLAVAALLTAAAIGAASLPARRATRTPPMTTSRAE